MSFLSRLTYYIVSIKVFLFMLKEGSRTELDKELAETFRQMCIITDAISNSLSQKDLYSASELVSIRELETISIQLSASLSSLIDAFQKSAQISNPDAVLATETISQCKEFIATLQPHLLAE